MNNIIDKNTGKKRYHIFEKNELTLKNVVRICRYCTISGEFYNVEILEENWYSFYDNKITIHLKNEVTEEEYIFLNRNLTPKELANEKEK